MEELSDKVRGKIKGLISSHLFSQELKEIFQAIDTDKSNTLTLSEVRGERFSVKSVNILNKVVLFLKSITNDLSESNIEKIFNGIDSSGDMKIDFIEFKVGFNY